MSYSPGSSFYRSFVTQTNAGVLQNADALPTAILRRNGQTDSSTAATVTIVPNASVGDYTASGVIPCQYCGGDDVELVITVRVAGVAGELVIALGPLDDDEDGGDGFGSHGGY